MSSARDLDSAEGPPARVAIITLGCARNEVDSEELAHRLAGDGWQVVEDPQQADAVLVNTCGFVEAAKKDSIDTVLEAAGEDGVGPAVVAVGCLAERYGTQLAEVLPEADAVLGFDEYPAISSRLRSVLAGEAVPSHAPADRRRLLPIAPVERQQVRAYVPGHAGSTEPEAAPGGWQPPVLRRRLGHGPIAPLKLASGCDRRCTFCAIPSFRGSFISRPAQEIIAEAAWLAADDVREIVLVSENSTSYGKDLGDVRLLEALLPRLGEIDGIERIRVAYLQPAEVRMSLLDAMVEVEAVAPYFDLSFQHASPAVLRRMRRFGDGDAFLSLIEQVRRRCPQAGIRSNVIVGFPGETEADVEALAEFLQQARLDAVGIFGYSDEEGTPAADLDGKLGEAEIRDRVAAVSSIAEEVMSQRAEDRLGEAAVVLVEGTDEGDVMAALGRAGHQGAEDGATRIMGLSDLGLSVLGSGVTDTGAVDRFRVGELVACTIVGSDGVDLLAAPA